MTGSFQNIILLHDFLEGAFIRHISLIYRFQRYKLTRKSIYRQVNFSKRAFSDDFTNLIPINLSLINLVRNVRQNAIQNQFSGCQLPSLCIYLCYDTWWSFFLNDAGVYLGGLRLLTHFTNFKVISWILNALLSFNHLFLLNISFLQ